MIISICVKDTNGFQFPVNESNAVSCYLVKQFDKTNTLKMRYIKCKICSVFEQSEFSKSQVT